MIRKLTLAVGFSAGYVLGAKAGKERYDQIEAKVRELLGQPAVQDFTNKASTSASAAADKAKATVNDKVSAVGDKVGSSSDTTPSTSTSTSTMPITDDVVVVDLGASGAATSTSPVIGGPVIGGPVRGASPSGTAPDVL